MRLHNRSKRLVQTLATSHRQYSTVYLWGSFSSTKKTLRGKDDRLLPKVLEHGIDGDNIVGIGCGSTHMACVTSNGLLYSAGVNTSGQCAQPSTMEVVDRLTIVNAFAKDDDYWNLKLEKVNDRSHDSDSCDTIKFSSVVCGKDHTLAITEDRRDLYASGLNDAGQLGIGYCKNRYKLHRVPLYVESTGAGNLIKQVACGAQHTILLYESGDLYCFGSNSFGQMANPNSSSNHLKPKQIKHLTLAEEEKVISVACGMAHTLFLTDKHRLFAVGRGYEGQLGEDVKQAVSPVALNTINSKGRVHKISAGYNHSLALVEEDQKANVYIWGNGYKEGAIAWGGGHATVSTFQKKDDQFIPKLCFSTSIEQIDKIKLASGAYHSLLSVDNEVYSVGQGSDGQLGNGGQGSTDVFQRVILPESIDKITSIGSGFAYSVLVLQ